MKRIEIKKLYIFIMLFVITFQEVLTNYFVFFRIFDEAISIIFFVYGLVIAINAKRIKKIDIILLICVFIYYILGWISTLFNMYQLLFVSFFSSFLSVKFFLLFFGARWGGASSKNMLIDECIHDSSTMCIFLMTLYHLVSLTDIGLVRLWEGDICAKIIFLVSLIYITWKNRKVDYITLFISFVMLLFTKKAKGYAAALFVVACLFWIIIRKRKVEIKHIFIMACVAVCVAWEKIYFYYFYGHGQYARSLLTMTGIKIANDRFPLGTGWGSYATYYSSIYYSPVYYIYGLNSHGELGESARMFIMDTYWPAVIGEAGWISGAAILLFLVLVYCQISKNYSRNHYIYAAGILSLCYLLVTTVEESGLMQPVLMCLAIVLGITSKQDRYVPKVKVAKEEKVKY